ncbi:hypothetical protein OG472_01625 [Streptomyces sp. NBC_00207]
MTKQHPQRDEDQVLLDPPGQVGAVGPGQAAEFVPGEVTVGQQHVRLQGSQQSAGEPVLAQLGHGVEGRVDRDMGPALGQRHQTDLCSL